MKLILASASPRRAEILRDARIMFEAMPAHVDEARREGEAPMGLVLRLAEAKARAVAARADGPCIVVGADTEVVLEGDVLGKPGSAEHASAMLRRLAGRTHEVITGLALIRLPEGALHREQEVTRVTFAPMSAEEIAEYVASGEPFDKAGGYAIQGRGGRFVTRVEGCYFNIVGLPLARLYAMLREMGWQFRG